MAHTYPLTVSYNDSMGSKENPLSFASLRLVDLLNGHSQYLSTLKQLRDAPPKTLDPASSFTLRGHIARPGQLRLRHSMIAALWFLLPSDGEFRRSSTSLQYYLTCQERHVVLRGGDVTRTPLESCLNWITDAAPIPPRNDVKENLPPSAEPRKLPRKMRPRRQRKEHHHHLGATGSAPGTSQPPRCTRSNPVKHPQPLVLPQHPQPPGPAANHNSARPDLLDQAELGRLYPEERRFSQKLFSAVELLCILLCADFGIQTFIFHHTSEPRFLYVEKGQLVIRSSSFSTRAPFSLC